MKIEIVRGAMADSLVADEGFRANWSRLAADCPWATACQTPGFVATWYGSYRSRVEPVLVLGRGEERGRDGGDLVGLLPLALTSRDDRLVVAGGHQAEYHAWVSPPGMGDDFARNAVKSVLREFPSKSLGFRYLPPGTPLGWLADHGVNPFCTLKARRRPLMRFNDGEEIRASLSKEGNKGRIRRLGRLGRMEFKRVTDPGELEGYFDAIIPAYDTRRMALGGTSPFRDDNLKRPFHLGLMTIPRLLHATVLRVGDRVAAAHLGVCGAKEVQFGLIAHDPFLAKYSPGKLLMLFLAGMLHDEGFAQLDLTAGGEPYKERFANAWDEVHTLGIHPSRSARVKAAAAEGIEEVAKIALHRFGIRPSKVQLVAGGAKRIRPSGLPGFLFGRARAWTGGRVETRIYSRGPAEPDGRDLTPGIRRDALEDLLAYDPLDGGASTHEFVSAALDRIEENQHPYTVTEAGCLLHIGWLSERPSEAILGRVFPGLTLPPNSSLVLDLFTVPRARGRGLAGLSLRAMLRDAARIPAAGHIFVAVPAKSGPALRLVEGMGFRYERSLVQVTRFGRSRPSIDQPRATPVASNPPTPKAIVSRSVRGEQGLGAVDLASRPLGQPVAPVSDLPNP